MVVSNSARVEGDGPDWAQAPAGWDWAAQDEDGRWFWYGVKPLASLGGGVWRAPSRAQQLAGVGLANADWVSTLRKRPDPGVK